MSPFPQSVAYSNASPAVFPSPPAVVQVVVVQLGAPKYLQWPRWIVRLNSAAPPEELCECDLCITVQSVSMLSVNSLK